MSDVNYSINGFSWKMRSSFQHEATNFYSEDDDKGYGVKGLEL